MTCANKSPQTDHAGSYAADLLAELCCESPFPPALADHPAVAWKRAGLLELSGMPGGDARMVPLPLASAADGALMAIRALCPEAPLPACGAAVLGERARMMGFERNGPASPIGHCRLLECHDGRLALNMARPGDWNLLPAWLEQEVSDWEGIAAAIEQRSVGELVARGAEIGLAVARDTDSPANPWIRRHFLGERSQSRPARPLVVDLSSLWGGPLAGSLLQACDMQVVKVESVHRPDAARSGHAGFFDVLNSGKRSVVLPFHEEAGREALLDLVAAADIVVEASRPRALRQLGVEAEALVAERPGKVWLRLLAHGDDPMRIGFGDDIGVAAGLPIAMETAWGEPFMVGDAIADPLSGLHAACAALASWQSGGGELVTLSMRDVVRWAMGELDARKLPIRAREWTRIAEADDQARYPLRAASSPAEPLGHSTQAVVDSIC